MLLVSQSLFSPAQTVCEEEEGECKIVKKLSVLLMFFRRKPPYLSRWSPPDAVDDDDDDDGKRTINSRLTIFRGSLGD